MLGQMQNHPLLISSVIDFAARHQGDTEVVSRRVEGDIHRYTWSDCAARARQVQLASTARIEGDIVHSALSVESGAFFDGHCRHASDPLSDKPSSSSSKTSSPASASSSPAPSRPASTSGSASTSSSQSPLDMPTAKSAN